MKNKLRICLLSSGHHPNDDRIFFKEARSLAKKYNDVWIVSPYPSDVPLEKNGVQFLSVSTYSRNISDRFKNMKSLYRDALRLKADIYHCHEPESLIVANKLKKALGCKIIFDSHEMYSATLAQRFPKFLHSQIMNLYKRYERRKVRECDFVIGATWSISEYLSEIAGKERTETILNCTLPEIFGKVPENKSMGKIIICHDGSLPFSRGLKTMVKAVDIIRKKYPVQFKIIGDVYGQERQWLESYISKHKMNDVITRTGWLDYRYVGQAMSECHIGLLALEKLPNHEIAAPNKIFNYMYFGLPFVAPDFCTDIKKLIEEENCGVTADSTSGESYAQAIIHLIESREKFMEMGLNAKMASAIKYNWNIMEKTLFDIYEKIE